MHRLLLVKTNRRVEQPNPMLVNNKSVSTWHRQFGFIELLKIRMHLCFSFLANFFEGALVTSPKKVRTICAFTIESHG